MPPVEMRAATIPGRGRIDVTRRPVPEPGRGEVRVRVEACGLCGSDLHLLHAGFFPPNQVPGHEPAGVIDAIGRGAASPALGTRVAIEPIRGCGGCPICLSGRYSICRDAKLAGVHLPGGLAEFVVVPAENVYPVPPDLDPRVAALAEPMAVVVHALHRANFQSGQRVLVLGAGSVGLLAAAAARRLGAGEIWVTARHPHQRERALALGATRVLDDAEATPAALDGIGRDAPIDLVVETVGGTADTLRGAVAAARPGGTVSVVGMFLGDVTLDPMPLLLKELTLAWSFCYGEDPAHGADFAEAVDIIAAAREALTPLITHTVPLDEAARGFALAADRRAGAIKVSVVP
jgi:2-desacetyl-2-hydroxyethyl bacteriochlorophyllide A dehydrogenase